jgi:hypothetical protein
MNDLTQHFQSINWNNSEKVNSVFKLLFSHYHKDKNFPYESILNKVEGYLPNKYKNQFLYRKDGRTLGQFGVDIYSGHLLERNIADWWFSNFGQKHFGNSFEYECVGIDDSGTLLLEDKGKNEMKRPDYLIKPNTYVEIKSNICDWKITPKISDLKHYISLNSYVLLVCSNGKFRENGKNCSCYMLLDSNQCKDMIKNSVILNDRFECGNKPCIQFYWDLSEEERKTKIMMNKLSSKALNIKDFCEVQYL